MTNPHGTPIWYELATRDADAASVFYAAVIGWDITPRPDAGMDYRMIVAADGGNAGAVAGLGPDTPPAAATPGWRWYVGVDNVDSAVTAIGGAGGSVAIPAFDLPGVGRMALVRDPQGIAFFVMRGAVEGGTSTVFDRTGLGKCNWNELATTDQAGANAFYAEVFGWTYPDRMTMPGDMGDYVFIQAGGEQLGATMTARVDGPPPGWTFYFRAADIEAAAAAVRANGGTVHMGPVEVPGGDRIVLASDPEGLMFGVVGPGTAAD